MHSLPIVGRHGVPYCERGDDFAMRVKHVILGILATACLVGALSACGGGNNASSGAGAETATAATGGGIDPSLPPVRVPVIAVKVPGLDLLDPYVAGATAAAETINAEGGIGGREVKIDPCSTELDTATVNTCAHSTVDEEGVIAAFGCEVTWAAGGAQIYAKAGIPSLNCTATPEASAQFTFSMHPGSAGWNSGVAAWACEQGNIHSVVTIGQDLPDQRKELPAAQAPILEACGKSAKFVFAPFEGTDFTPQVNEALAGNPDLVVVEHSPAQAALIFKLLQQGGYPIDQTAVIGSSCTFENLNTAGSAMEGTICLDGWVPWDHGNSDPEVAKYVEAMERYAPNVDYRSGNTEYAYAHMMWIYQAAQEIGVKKFTPESFAKYMRTANGVHVPLSRNWTNPAPEGYAQIKQPSIFLARWQNGAQNTVEEGTDHGWIDGYAKLAEAKEGS